MTQASPHSGERPPAREAETKKSLCLCLSLLPRSQRPLACSRSKAEQARFWLSLSLSVSVCESSPPHVCLALGPGWRRGGGLSGSEITFVNWSNHFPDRTCTALSDGARLSDIADTHRHMGSAAVRVDYWPHYTKLHYTTPSMPCHAIPCRTILLLLSPTISITTDARTRHTGTGKHAPEA